MSAVTQHVPVLSDLVSDSHSNFFFFKLEESGLCPFKALVASPCGPLLSDRVLTQFRSDSDSSINSARLGDPYLCQNTDLCPLL